MADNALDFRDRGRVFAALEAQTFDVIVIGGGVTGAGVARDAAMRGLSVALVEARDFASGTSSKSSKMIHGGLRYMAQGDLGLVHEAASERKAVERIAPHLTRQTPFVIPAKNAAVTAKLRAGLWAFEKLGGVPKDRRHEVWGKKELEAKEPALDARELSGAVVYPEYLTDDAKLTVANVRSAQANGAVVASYAPVQELIVEGGKAVGVVVGDGFGGGGARVKGKVIVNAAGPWVDALRKVEDPAAASQLKLSKGVHLVFDKARLPVERTIIIPAGDRRSVFVVPKNGFTYLGTTDTFYPETSYWPAITTEDVAYLLAAANARFAIPALAPADVMAAWSGTRPLVAEEGKSPSEISRKDEVWTGPAGVIAIAGGKLTAYRQMAERVVDLAEEALGRKPTPARTAETPLVTGDVAPKAMTAQTDARLTALYGSEAPEAVGGPAAEARHAVLKEGALKLEDWWARRSARAFFDAEGGMGALAPAAAEMAGLLGWDAKRTNAEIEACRRIRSESLSFQQAVEA